MFLHSAAVSMFSHSVRSTSRLSFLSCGIDLHTLIRFVLFRIASSLVFFHVFAFSFTSWALWYVRVLFCTTPHLIASRLVSPHTLTHHLLVHTCHLRAALFWLIGNTDIRTALLFTPAITSSCIICFPAFFCSANSIDWFCFFCNSIQSMTIEFVKLNVK